MQVGIYTRLSFDDERDGLAVRRQETDARALCQRLGWEVARVYTDNSVSAYKRNVRRPAWEELLDDLKSGRIGGIAAYDIDRIARQPRDLERLIDIYEDVQGLVFATVSGEIDLSKHDARLMARIMVSFANKSSADTGRRQARKQLELAQRGLPSGGGTKPYGYERDGMTINEAEAAVVRDMAARVLTGESLTSICRSHGFKDRSTVKRILIKPRLAGLMVYRGSLLVDDKGHPVKAVWPPILDLETWEAVRAVLTDPKRELSAGRIDREYLLSGFLRCKCGAKMWGVTKKGVRHYQCAIDRGCGGTHRVASGIDEHITELVLRYLERQEVLIDESPGIPVNSLDSEISAAEQSLANLIAEWDAGRMSDAVFFAAQAKREATLTALKRQRAGERRRRLSRAPVGQGVREIWASSNVSQRRAILADVLLAVLVLPKPKNAPKRFDPKYYGVQWQQTAS